MIFCCYCGNNIPAQGAFCPYCGKTQPRLSENMENIPYSQPHTPYSFTAEPVVSNAGKVLGKIGMILGIAAAASGLLANILFLLLNFSEISTSGISISYEPLPLILGIAALILCVKARKKGNLKTGTRLGLILGIIGIVLGAVSIILFFIFAVGSSGLSDMPGFSM